MTNRFAGHSSLLDSFQIQLRVIHAIILRDIRTRFFGHGLGYLLAVAWPLVHIAVLLAINTATGRKAPYGDSVLVFIVTALVPFISFSYMSRMVVYSMASNRPLLSFPVVKGMDILLARAILELLASCVVVLILMAVLWVMGIDFMPRNIVQASYAFAASLVLGFGFGILNGVIAMAFVQWMTGYTLIIIVIWITCGFMFVPDALPENMQAIIAVNPVLHAVEWMRTAYYDGYGTQVLSKSYLLWSGFGSLALGLLAERLIRGHLLKG